MNFPEFCKDCHKVETCKQKQNMLAGTEPVDGFADFEATEHFCSLCLNHEHDHESMSFTEVDSPAHCIDCGVPLYCSLTTDGIEYVNEAVKNGGGCCRELWPVLFADYLS